jgi:hypothetical protein
MRVQLGMIFQKLTNWGREHWPVTDGHGASAFTRPWRQMNHPAFCPSLPCARPAGALAQIAIVQRPRQASLSSTNYELPPPAIAPEWFSVGSPTSPCGSQLSKTNKVNGPPLPEGNYGRVFPPTTATHPQRRTMAGFRRVQTNAGKLACQDSRKSWSWAPNSAALS